MYYTGTASVKGAFEKAGPQILELSKSQEQFPTIPIQTKFIKAQERESWQEGKISMKIITCEQVSCGHPNIEHKNGAEDDVHQTKEEVIDVG